MSKIPQYPYVSTEHINDVTISFTGKEVAGKKFASKHLDHFETFFRKHLATCLNSKKKLILDLSKLCWIEHEEYVYLSALCHQLYLNGMQFQIRLDIGADSYPADSKDEYRNRNTRIFLWENWHAFFNEAGMNKDTIDQYFDISQEYIDDLKELQNENHYYTKIISLKSLPISYDENGAPLDVNGSLINERLKLIYRLSEDTHSLLQQYNSTIPFSNKTLSHIITKELYENTIEHAYIGSKTIHPYCYMSVSLLRSIYKDGATIQSIKGKQYDDEAIQETIDFYRDDKGEWKNQSYIQFTLMDLGMGIPASLKSNSQMKNGLNTKSDSNIIIEAINSSLSRHLIDEQYSKGIIPRGLKDVISVMSLYRGLVIIRSGKGKVLYDFSRDTTDLSKCAKPFGDSNLSFKGTIVTLLIPESTEDIPQRHLQRLSKVPMPIEISAIKKELYYIKILDIQKDARNSIEASNEDVKEHIYNRTLEFFVRKLDTLVAENKNCTIITDFNSCEDRDCLVLI